jgi:beta-galactosidase
VFDQPATPDEIVIKLMSWRNRSYPVRITVDDKEVFADTAPTSLGYVHLPLKPVTGTRLRIQLTAPAQGQGGINLTELANTKDSAATGVGLTSNGTLSIVEVEIYQEQTH